MLRSASVALHVYMSGVIHGTTRNCENDVENLNVIQMERMGQNSFAAIFGFADWHKLNDASPGSSFGPVVHRSVLGAQSIVNRSKPKLECQRRSGPLRKDSSTIIQ